MRADILFAFFCKSEYLTLAHLPKQASKMERYCMGNSKEPENNVPSSLEIGRRVRRRH